MSDDMSNILADCHTVYHFVLFGDHVQHTVVSADVKVGDGVVLHGEGSLRVTAVVVAVENGEE